MAKNLPSLVFKTLILASGICTALIMLNINNYVHAAEPISTPDPTTESILATQSALSIEVDELSNELKNTRREMNIAKEELSIQVQRQLLDTLEPYRNFGLLLTFIFLLITASGIGGYLVVWRTSNKKVREILEKELYKLDPTFLPVFLPESDFEAEIERIIVTGLKNIERYNILSKRLLNGVVIVQVENDNEQKMFSMFIEEYKPDPSVVAFILYSRGKKYSISEEVLLKHNNTTVATNPTALSRAILDVGRGLKPK